MLLIFGNVVVLASKMCVCVCALHGGASACILIGADVSPSAGTLNVMAAENDVVRLTMKGGTSQFADLHHKRVFHVVSRAFSTSQNVSQPQAVLCKRKVTWSVNFIRVVWSNAAHGNGWTRSDFVSTTRVRTVLNSFFVPFVRRGQEAARS